MFGTQRIVFVCAQFSVPSMPSVEVPKDLHTLSLEESIIACYVGSGHIVVVREPDVAPAQMDEYTYVYPHRPQSGRIFYLTLSSQQAL